MAHGTSRKNDQCSCVCGNHDSSDCGNGKGSLWEAVRGVYQKKSVFKLSTVDYFKCLSMFYDIEGVVSVKTFTINGGTESISIGEKEIQVTGSIDIEGAVG